MNPLNSPALVMQVRASSQFRSRCRAVAEHRIKPIGFDAGEPSFRGEAAEPLELELGSRPRDTPLVDVGEGADGLVEHQRDGGDTGDGGIGIQSCRRGAARTADAFRIERCRELLAGVPSNRPDWRRAAALPDPPLALDDRDPFEIGLHVLADLHLEALPIAAIPRSLSQSPRVQRIDRCEQRRLLVSGNEIGGFRGPRWRDEQCCRDLLSASAESSAFKSSVSRPQR